MDILVTNDVSPRFDLGEKSFACVDGAIAVVSIRSDLDKRELFEALDNIASVPRKRPLNAFGLVSDVRFTDGTITRNIEIPHYNEWPFKMIYSARGPQLETLMKNLMEYCETHNERPANVFPNMIHVGEEYSVIRTLPGQMMQHADGQFEEMPKGWGTNVAQGPAFHLQYAIQNIQRNAVASQFILFEYEEMMKRAVYPNG